jgi:hypothetical protein
MTLDNETTQQIRDLSHKAADTYQSGDYKTSAEAYMDLSVVLANLTLEVSAEFNRLFDVLKAALAKS